MCDFFLLIVSNRYFFHGIDLTQLSYMMLPSFPDIEIDIPDLTEIKKELTQTRSLLKDLQDEVQRNKIWKTALENALMSYGKKT